MRGRRGVNEDPISLFSFQDIITSVTGIIILLALLLVVELTKRPQEVLSDGGSNAASLLQSEIHDLESRISSLKELLASSSKFANEIASVPSADLHTAEQEARNEIAALEAALAQLSQDEKAAQLVAGSQVEDVTSAEDILATMRASNDELASQLDSVRRSNRVIYNSDNNAAKSAWLVDLKPDCIEVGRPDQRGSVTTFDSADFSASFLAWAKQRSNHSEYFVLLVRPNSIRLYEELNPVLKEAGFTLGFDLVSVNASVLDSDGATEVQP